MIIELLRWIGYLTLVYFIAMQTYLVYLALRSAGVMRRNHHMNRFGRVSDMLSSQTSPPISIVIPAYNEEVGVVEAVRSMSIVGYPRFEIVIANDGSTDGTLDRLIEAFDLERVQIPYRLGGHHGGGQRERRTRRRIKRRHQRRPLPVRLVHRCRRDP